MEPHKFCALPDDDGTQEAGGSPSPIELHSGTSTFTCSAQSYVNQAAPGVFGGGEWQGASAGGPGIGGAAGAHDMSLFPPDEQFGYVEQQQQGTRGRQGSGLFVDILGGAHGVPPGLTTRSDGKLHVEHTIFCHQPPFKTGCAAHGKQIRNIGWASKTGDRNAFRCRSCGSQWSQDIRVQPGQDPRIDSNVKRAVGSEPRRSGGYRHDIRKGGCGRFKRESNAVANGEEPCRCRVKKGKRIPPVIGGSIHCTAPAGKLSAGLLGARGRPTTPLPPSGVGSPPSTGDPTPIDDDPPIEVTAQADPHLTSAAKKDDSEGGSRIIEVCVALISCLYLGSAS